MAYHWKHGNGFAIRYGGPEGIRWFYGEEFPRAMDGLGQVATAHPIGLALKGLEVAVQFLQWWELRKSNLLLSAQFEERRIPWLVDMMSLWHQEMRDGAIHLRTARYLQRETSRLADALVQEKRADIPSAILLAVDRTSESVRGWNRFMAATLKASAPDFVLPEHRGDHEFEYRPYRQLLEGATPRSIQDYLRSAGVAAGAAAALISPVGLLRMLGLVAAASAAALTANDLDRARAMEFEPLLQLGIELTGAIALLRSMERLPVTEHQYEIEDTQHGPRLRELDLAMEQSALADPGASGA